MARAVSASAAVLALCIGVAASERNALMTKAGEPVSGLDGIRVWSHPMDFVGGLLRSALSTTNVTVSHRGGHVECLRLAVDDSLLVEPLLDLAAPLASSLGLNLAPPRVEHNCGALVGASPGSCSFTASPLAQVWVTWSPACGGGQPVILDRASTGFAPRHRILAAVGGSLLFFLAPLLGHNVTAIYASGSLLLLLGLILIITWKVASRFASRRVAIVSVFASSLGLPVAAGIASLFPGWDVWAEEHRAALGGTLLALFLLSLAATHIFISKTDILPLQQLVSAGLRLIGLALVLAGHASPTAGWIHVAALVAVAAFQDAGGPTAALAVIEALTPSARRRPRGCIPHDRITPEVMREVSLRATATEMEKLRERCAAASPSLPSRPSSHRTALQRLAHTTFDKMATLSPDALLAASRLVSRSSTPADEAALTEEQLSARTLLRTEAWSTSPVRRRRAAAQMAHAWRSEPRRPTAGRIPGGWLNASDAGPVDRSLWKEFETVAESGPDDEGSASPSGSESLSDEPDRGDERLAAEAESAPRPRHRFRFGAR